MKKSILAIVLTLSSSAAFAGAGAFDNNNQAEYNGSMYNSNAMSNVQVNNSGSSYTSMDNITCPTGTWTAGGAFNDTQMQHGADANSGTVMLSYNHPTDLNGTISRCVKAQRAAVITRQQNNDFDVIRNCIAAKNANIYLDPTVFSWAKQCKGVQPMYVPPKD